MCFMTMQEKQILPSAIEIQKGGGGNHTFLRDDEVIFTLFFLSWGCASHDYHIPFTLTLLVFFFQISFFHNYFMVCCSFIN